MKKVLAGLASLAVAAATATVGLADTLPARDRPNILLITADDLGMQLSCYGDRNIATPHLDKLASSGVRFTRAYVTQPSCSPSRSSMFTGLYPSQTGHLGLSHYGFGIQQGIPNLTVTLRNAGFRTALIGKLHVGPAKSFAFDLAEGGFDTATPWPKDAENTRDVEQVGKTLGDFITKAPGPFFVKLSLLDPHGPFSPTVKGYPQKPITADDMKSLQPPFKDTDEGRKEAAAYYNCIKRLDDGVGIITTVLKDKGVEKNTLVIFVSDNGLPFPKGKCTLYEGGTRVPLMISWPGHVKADIVNNNLVSTVDLVPTILEYVGLPMYKGNNRVYEGRSLKRLLEGEQVPGFRQYLFTEMTFHRPMDLNIRRAATDGRYKLIRGYGPQAGVELYDLEKDPNETDNLAVTPGAEEHLRRLDGELTRFLERVQDPVLSPEKVRAWEQISAKARAEEPKTKRDLVRPTKAGNP